MGLAARGEEEYPGLEHTADKSLDDILALCDGLTISVPSTPAYNPPSSPQLQDSGQQDYHEPAWVAHTTYTSPYQPSSGYTYAAVSDWTYLTTSPPPYTIYDDQFNWQDADYYATFVNHDGDDHQEFHHWDQSS